MKPIHYLFVILFLVACGPEKRPLIGDTTYQRKMNADFKDASKSPLKKKDRENFTGLDFFPFDTTYSVTAHLDRTPNSEYFEMPTTTGETSRERIYGAVMFELKGQSYKLYVYQAEDVLTKGANKEYLFLPFSDHTNGKTTYAGGRYLNLSIPEGNTISIDFNKAYNPYCAYNEKFSCPLVPKDNYLPTAIKAGVKSYKKNN